MGLYDSLIKLLNPQPPRTPLLTLLGGGVDLDAAVIRSNCVGTLADRLDAIDAALDDS